MNATSIFWSSISGAIVSPVVEVSVYAQVTILQMRPEAQNATWDLGAVSEVTNRSHGRVKLLCREVP